MELPKVVVRNGRKMLLVDGEPFILLSGELHNSSSSTTAYMEPIWERMAALHLNSLLFPVTWQQLEPVEGEFHFDLVDGLIAQARAHGMRIGLLWFGAWKNANCSYVPDWVKTDLERFPRAELEKGARYKEVAFGQLRMPYTTLSAFCAETTRADARAFAALCAHLRDADTERTVVLIQVENETGILGASRDHSDLADAAFAAPVPRELVEGLLARREGLVEDVRAALERRREGSWQEVFGEAADEVFMAWHTARHIEAVASAGKGEYPIPMYANCWLVQGGKPGMYPSGGPVYRVLEVYQVAAPSLDWLAPDIYVPEFCGTCARYAKQGNPLFIPETALHSGATARLIWAVGQCHALCFAPFGIDDIGSLMDASLGAGVGMDVSDERIRTRLDPREYARVNALLRGLTPLLAARYGTDDLQAVIAEEPDRNEMTFGDIRLRVQFGLPGGAEGLPSACLAARTGPREFCLLGVNCMPRFASLDPEKPYLEYLTIEEGEFAEGAWKLRRVLNGDDEYLRLREPTVLRLTVHPYA